MNSTAVIPSDATAWLLLIHQLPPKPDYLRAKVRRRLDQIGALPLKNSVYVLPRTDETAEDLAWLAREIVADGGEATVCSAGFIAGVRDADLRGAFRAARGRDYTAVASEARALRSADRAAQRPRLRRRFDQITSIDFFPAAERREAERALAALESPMKTATGKAGPRGKLRGRTWVTRTGVKVDRISSAWLIRRFLDPGARFKFVPPKGYLPARGELRFDMLEGEYTHAGNRCTFETLLAECGLRGRALRAIADLVHDLDCKDEKFSRPETAGFGALIRGVVETHAGDAARIAHGGPILDALYASFSG